MACISISFLLKIIPLYVYNTFCPYPSKDARLASTFLAIMNDVASNVGVQISLCDPAFNSLGCLLRSGSPGSYCTSIFEFLRKLLAVFHSSFIIYIPTNSVQGSSFFKFSPEILLLKDVCAATLLIFQWSFQQTLSSHHLPPSPSSEAVPFCCIPKPPRACNPSPSPKHWTAQPYQFLYLRLWSTPCADSPVFLRSLTLTQHLLEFRGALMFWGGSLISWTPQKHPSVWLAKTNSLSLKITYVSKVKLGFWPPTFLEMDYVFNF